MNTANHISQRLIDGLRRLQATQLDLPLVPLNGNKQPLGDEWQNRPMKAVELIEAINDGGVEVPIGRETKKIQPQGFGVLTGRPITLDGETYYLMALDCDGAAAAQKILSLGNGSALPKTVAFTSGRTGRCQYLFKVPQAYCDAIKTKKIKTASLGDDGSLELLELRWKNLQSVLPPSVHPMTGEYRWVSGCAIDETPIAEAPTWVIEQMLIDPRKAEGIYPYTECTSQRATEKEQEAPQRNGGQNTWTDIDFALAYLNALASYRAEDYDDWLTVGMALHSVDDSLLADWDSWSSQSSKYKPGECLKKWKSFSSNGGVTLGTLAHKAKLDGWQFPKTSNFAQANHNHSHSPNRNGAKTSPSKKPTVTGDNTWLSDSFSPDWLDFTATVTTVTAILEKGLPDYAERDRLDAVQSRSGMSKAAFWQLVAARRCSLDEISQEDTARFNQLIDWHNEGLDFKKVLPQPLADAFLHDAQILNLDPISLWQYFLPAVLSFVGKRVNLDVESHQIPAIIWTCLVSESGTGKSRAEGVILAPLRKLQYQERQRFFLEVEEYKKVLKVLSKGDPEPDAPKSERKYLFEIATIQAVMRRLASQGQNGSLWARDEIAGLFKSLGQFSKASGESEGLECLLKMWDGHGSFVDRVDAEKDSYAIEEIRLSLAGGIQPGAFRQVFKDPNDAQGLQARFLYAVPKIYPAKRVKGYCYLSDLLPALYQWLDTLPTGSLKLSRDADNRYTNLVSQIGTQAEAEPCPTIRAWMRKLPTQLLRLAFCLHLVECYFDGARPFWELQRDTLERAAEFCRYYRSGMVVIQEKVAERDSSSSILLKIWDMAVTQPGGVTPRDIYRSIKAIGRRALQVGREVGAYTLDLLCSLVKMGKGIIEQKGRTIRFFATLNPPNPPSGPDGDNPQGGPDGDNLNPNPSEMVTQVTVASSRLEEELQPSLNGELSLVTDVNPSERSEVQWLLELLADMEQANLLRFPNTEELDVVLSQAEQKAALCLDQLNQVCRDYWERVGLAWGTLASALSGNSSEEVQPTLAELKALLLAAQTLTDLRALKKKYPDRVRLAYHALCQEQQLLVDGLAASLVPHEVFKYTGPTLLRDGQKLVKDALVYLDPSSSKRSKSPHVKVWWLKGVSSGWNKAIEVSRDCLVAVEKALTSGVEIVQGEQGMLFEL
jgi:hypothetical protein